MRESVGSLPSQNRDSWGLWEPPELGAGGSLAPCAGGRGAHPAVHRSVVVAVFPLRGLEGPSPPRPPLEGLGVNKADGRGLWRSLHGLASPLSSVSHLCGQASQGHCGQGQAPRVPLRFLYTDLCPAALSVGCYLLPQGRNPLSPGTRPCLGGSQRCDFSTHALGFPRCRQSLSGAMQNPLGENGEGPPPSAVPARWLLL